jgi:hypothetical protein
LSDRAPTLWAYVKTLSECSQSQAIGVLVLLERVAAKPRTALAEVPADDGHRVTAGGGELS